MLCCVVRRGAAMCRGHFHIASLPPRNRHFGALCQGPSRDNSVIQIGCATRSIFLALCPAQRVVAILTNCTAIHEWICTRGNPEPFHVRRKKASPVMKAFHCFFFCCGQALCRQATAPFQKPALLMSMNGSTCSALRLRHGPSHAVFSE